MLWCHIYSLIVVVVLVNGGYCYLAVVFHKALFRISHKWGGTFAGVGHPFLGRFPRGYEYFSKVPRGRGVSIFLHTQKETEQSKISLSRNSPTALDASFARFAPAALKSFRHPGGYPFLTATPRGYQNFTLIPRGGMCFLRALFPKRTPPPPPNKKF